MILLIAVIVGLIAGLLRALIGRRPYRVYDLKWPILVLIAFIPQYFAIFNRSTRTTISDNLASILLVGSLVILLVFSLLNIRKTSFWPITLGFFLNFLVILLNRGFMPISPATVSVLYPGQEGAWSVGERLGYGKDIVLAPATMRLGILSDRFLLPQIGNLRVAFSAGDVFIAVGVIWLLWSLGGVQVEQKQEKSQ
jgi:hypothetical protein